MVVFVGYVVAVMSKVVVVTLTAENHSRSSLLHVNALCHSDLLNESGDVLLAQASRLEEEYPIPGSEGS